MDLYGSDKPDLRFDMKLQDFGRFVATGSFEVFKKTVADGGVVKASWRRAAESISRKKIGELEQTAKVYGAAGLASMKVTEAGLDTGISRFFADQAAAPSFHALGAKPGDLILLVGAERRKACLSLGAVRQQLGRELGLCKPSDFRFCWIVDFPLFEWNEDEKKWDPAHHMFTMPQDRFLADFEKRPGGGQGGPL